MPRAPRHCPGDNGSCTNLIDASERYCPDCQPKSWQGKRTTSSAITNTAAWKRLRRAVLQRDRYTCQLRYDGCTRHATQVDHKVNTARGGAPLDPNNCSAVCAQCNARKASQEAANARRTRRAQQPKPLHPGLLR